MARKTTSGRNKMGSRNPYEERTVRYGHGEGLYHRTPLTQSRATEIARIRRGTIDTYGGLPLSIQRRDDLVRADRETPRNVNSFGTRTRSPRAGPAYRSSPRRGPYR